MVVRSTKHQQLIERIQSSREYQAYIKSFDNIKISKVSQDAQTHHSLAVLGKNYKITANMSLEKLVKICNKVLESKSEADDLIDLYVPVERALAAIIHSTEIVSIAIELEYNAAIGEIAKTASDKKAFVKLVMQEGHKRIYELRSLVNEIKLYLGNIDNTYWALKASLQALETIHKRI